MSRQYGRPNACSVTFYDCRKDIFDYFTDLIANTPGMSGKISPVMYWEGVGQERDLLIQFYSAQQLNGAWFATYELELWLGQDPGVAQEVLDELVDFVLLASHEVMDVTEAKVMSRSSTGLSPASGGSYSVLSVIGTRPVTYEEES